MVEAMAPVLDAVFDPLAPRAVGAASRSGAACDAPAPRRGPRYLSTPILPPALDAALAAAHADDLVLVTGSLFLVGEALVSGGAARLAIVPTLNGAHLLPECLRFADIGAVVAADVETTVTDGALIDGTQSLLASAYPRPCVWYAWCRNAGFSGNVNAVLPEPRAARWGAS